MNRIGVCQIADNEIKAATGFFFVGRIIFYQNFGDVDNRRIIRLNKLIGVEKFFRFAVKSFCFCDRIDGDYFKDSPWRTPRRVLKIVAVYPITETKTLYCEPKKFLHPNQFVQSDDATIINIAEILIKNYSTDEEKARSCFNFVVSYLAYANPIHGLYSSLQALTDRRVDCGGFSTLLVALLRAIKISARCVFGWAIQSKFGYHAWVEFYDRQKKVWVPADPSVSHLGNRTKLDAGFGFINDYRIALSVGEDIDLVGNKIFWTTPLLQSPVVVSFNEFGLPQPTFENLKWSIV